MPEASVGLFPDIGASHFLSRLPKYFGKSVSIYILYESSILNYIS